jgi:hypothetical protein
MFINIILIDFEITIPKHFVHILSIGGGGGQSWGCLSTQHTEFCMRPSTINRKITMHSYCRFILNNTRTTSGYHSDVHLTKIDIIHMTNIQIIQRIKH